MNSGVETRAGYRSLQRLMVAAGIGASVLFIVVGLWSRLEMFGDGSIFSYAVAAHDAWSFHWHNISGRLFTYFFAYIPAVTTVALTGNPRIGIAVYGLLFFSAQLLSLLVTLASDRTSGRVVFRFACLSTACLCPLVYGAPTEMWMAHAMFWPTLAACLCAPAGRIGAATVFIAMLALVFTHEGAIVLAAAMLFGLFLRGWRDAVFARALGAFIAAMAVWLIVKSTLRPDPYIAGVLAAAAYRFIDIRDLAQPALLLLIASLTIYGALIFLFRRALGQNAPVYAVFCCAIGLALYWLLFDRWLLTEARYDLRTALLIMIPIFGFLAEVGVMNDETRRKSPLPFLAWLADTVERCLNPQIIAGAILLTMLVHTVETTKFVRAWTEYKAALRTLATGTESDPALGSPLFVSSQRIRADLNRLSWNSTTPYLSVLVAPGLEPTRLVVDPGAGYFWLSCDTATESEQTSTAIPPKARRLIRIYSCLHR